MLLFVGAYLCMIVIWLINNEFGSNLVRIGSMHIQSIRIAPNQIQVWTQPMRIYI